MEKSDKLLANIQREIATLTAQCNAMSESTEKATVTQEERMAPRRGVFSMFFMVCWWFFDGFSLFFHGFWPFRA